LHPDGARANKRIGKEVRLSDILIQTSAGKGFYFGEETFDSLFHTELASAHHSKTLWWRILIEREPSHQLSGSERSEDEEQLVTTSVRVGLYVFSKVPVVDATDEVVTLPVSTEESMKEGVDRKVKEIHDRKAVKEEIKRERKKKEKQRSREHQLM